MPADGAMRRLFIYYRVAAARADEAVAAAMRMQQALREREAGLKAELLRRPEITDSQVTLMETFAFETASVDEALQARIEREAAAALAGFIVGARHVELFEPCA
jgi:hypothetical protein